MMPSGYRLPPPIVTRFAVIALLLVAWEIAGRYANRLFFRPLSEVVEAGAELLRDPNVQHAILTTFWELGLSFVLSVVVGIIIGMIVAANRLTYQSAYPVILLIYAIPQITVLPLFVLYFGPGPASKVAFGFSHGVFPIILNVVGGVQSVDRLLLASARSMGATPWKVFKRIIFPHLVPCLFTGMRLAMTACLLGVILGELYVSSGGIGFLTRQYTETFRPDRLFALVGVLALLAIVLNESLRRAELRFGRWR
jgi:ABC-type nitrate/sulfonate/bicarbonate transport system permease component